MISGVWSGCGRRQGTEKEAVMAITVLIVEDEEKIGRFLELELMHEGYGVMKAANCSE